MIRHNYAKDFGEIENEFLHSNLVEKDFLLIIYDIRILNRTEPKISKIVFNLLFLINFTLTIILIYY